VNWVKYKLNFDDVCQCTSVYRDMSMYIAPMGYIKDKKIIL